MRFKGVTMITYCTGNVLIKRKHFRRENNSSVLSLDNDEVLTTFAKGKKMYYVMGSTPFGNMTVVEYINYQRSLTSKDRVGFYVVYESLKRLGIKIKPHTKMCSLNEIKYRAVCFLSRVNITTDTVYLNFDNVAFSKRKSKQLSKILKVLKNNYMVYVAISDTRFIKRKCPVHNFTEFGIVLKSKKHRSFSVNKKIIKKALPSLADAKTLPSVSSVVKCS